MTGELRAFSHQCEERVLSFAADHSYVLDIDHQLAFRESLGRVAAAPCQFRNPRVDQLSFQHQPALGRRVDGRDS